MLVVFGLFGFGLLGCFEISKAEEVRTNASYTATGANQMVAERTKAEIVSLREEAQRKMDKLKDTASTLKDRVKGQDQQNRLMGRETALGQFDRAINVVGSARERIEAQLPKLKTLGINTALAESKLTEAKNKLGKAEELIAEAHDTLASTANELTTAQKDALRVKAREAQTLIKEAHDILVNVVKMLRDAVKAKKSGPNSGVGSGGGNVGTDGATPTFACSYAPAPTGCTYVQGPNYNNQNSCGMILQCNEPGEVEATPNPTPNEPQAQACPSYAPAPTGCKYVETGEVNACGPVITLTCPTQ